MNIPLVIITALKSSNLDAVRVSNALAAWVGQRLDGGKVTVSTVVRVGKLPSDKSQAKGKFQKASVSRTTKESIKGEYATPIHRFASWVCDIDRQEKSGITFDSVILPQECAAWLAKFGTDEAAAA